MSRLRKVIGTDRIVSVAGSYRLDAENDEIDARRFESLVAAARDDADPARVRELCLEAFDLWRGVPFADLADRTFLRNEVERLEDLRLNAVELCVEADLALGRHRQIIGSLRAAVAEFPFHERMWGYLMSALDEAGRQPEALEAYDELARLLHDEFDIEPNKELQVLRRRLVES
jgi:DNA-binding SARP family transcriptional activator